VLIVPESESFSSQRKRYFFRLAGSKRNSLKPVQSPDWLGKAGSSQLNVKLNSLVSRPRSRVCDFSAHCNGRARGVFATVKRIIQGLRAELRFVNLQISVTE